MPEQTKAATAADVTDAADTTTDDESAAAAGSPEDAGAGDADAGDADAGDAASARQPARRDRLEAEGDVAADFLEELLDIVDLDGDIDLDVEGGRATVAVVGGDLSALVGDGGGVLDALQELTRLAVLQETGERSRLMLDVDGFRAARRTELERQAAQAIDTVRGNAQPLPLAPMNPFERKVVHDTVAAAGLHSESEGEEPRRHVVVLPPR